MIVFIDMVNLLFLVLPHLNWGGGVWTVPCGFSVLLLVVAGVLMNRVFSEVDSAMVGYGFSQFVFSVASVVFSWVVVICVLFKGLKK
jgi:hypothetical protein